MSASVPSAVSCVECQRRKQKCNRQFPCNHCLKRGVSHLCRFISKATPSKTSREASSNGSQSGSVKVSRKRNLDDPDQWTLLDADRDDDDASSDLDVSGALGGLGYMPHHHARVLGHGSGPKTLKDVVDVGHSEQSEELRAALVLMPAKPYTDCLVDNWLSGANHHYYALYPPEFRTQYDGWWATPHDKVTPELTGLILRVCACSLHFIMNESVRVRLESELRADVLTLAERMHTAAEKLSASIPPGKGGLVHVQQLFLTAFWYKSAEKWTEAWHALSKAVRAANEIGLHQDSLSEGMSEFDREMRRRVWGVIYMWDFALGSMLSRPLLVNHADCTIVMPTLTLELNPERPDQPSPFRHMNLHCQLCLDMSAQFGTDADKTEVARKLRDVVYEWFEKLPAEYALKDPDIRWDREFDWVVFQRRYLHLIGYMSLFSTLRPFVTRDSGKPMTDLEVSLRAAGVQAALDLMDVSWYFFENLVSTGAKFHYAIFCIFDTSTIMCSAFVHDEARNLPQRERVLEAIRKGVRMLEELYSESKTTAALYRILKGLIAKMPLSATEQAVIGTAKRARPSKISVPKEQAAVEGPSSSPVTASSGQSQIFNTGNSETSGTAYSSVGGGGSGSSVSSVVSGPSSNVYGSSDVQSRPNPVGSVVTTSGYIPMVGSFVPLDSIVSPFPTAGGVVASGGFAPTNEFVQSASNFQFDNFASGTGGALPVSQAGWQASSQPTMNNLGNINTLQGDGNGLPQLDRQDPEVLEYWDWQVLGLGNPVSWNQPQVGVVDHNGGLSGDFVNQALARHSPSQSSDPSC
ncbi:Cutinase transcription factor 1 beta [Madurella mycetomatis]|uniref:Cutinase transcription factor 1 beta n=1 Tax=Madurella mycetomatis TaxID=100816 RepID=A0A175WEN8_9PEZI|nr:Cutinase transcription factor 1 beta [Madurella mycetomatis]